MAIVAYDYQKQCWIEGDAAIELLRLQLSDEIALLRSSQGDAYDTMIGARKDELLSLRESEFASLHSTTPKAC